MVPHLKRALSAYKDIMIRSFYHYTYMHCWWCIGRLRRKKITDQYAEEKKWVFSFYLKERSVDECLIEIGREFQITGPV